MNTTSSILLVCVVMCYVAVRFMLAGQLSRIWKEISTRLDVQHPDWEPPVGQSLWKTVMFHPGKLPEDSALSQLAGSYRRRFIIAATLIIALIAGMVALFFARRG